MNQKKSSRITVAMAISTILVIAVCIVLCCHYISQFLLKTQINSAINSVLLIRNNFEITDEEVRHMKSLNFNEMESDPINRRLASIATGIQFTEPVISIYLVAPLSKDEVKYTLDSTTTDFWDAPAGTPLDSIWLLNMAVDAQGNAVFKERDDIYRYTLTTDELKHAFESCAPYGTHSVDEWGDVITGYTPIFTVEGNFVGMLGVDYDVSEYNQRIHDVIAGILGIMAVALIALGTMFIWMYRRTFSEQKAQIKVEHEKNALLAREKETLTTILNNISVGIYVYHFSGKDVSILTANSFVLNLLGRDSRKVEGAKNDSLTKYAHPDDIQIVRNALATLRTPGNTIASEFRLKHSITNEYLWIAARGRSVAQADGSVYAYVCLMDNSEEKKLQDTQTALEIAQSASKAKTDFLSNMSHDMRTPMNGILGLVTLMIDQDLPESVLDNLRQIQMSGNYLLNLINDTLDVSKIEAHRLELHPIAVEAYKITENVYSNAQMLAAEKGVSCTLRRINSDSFAPAILRMDAARVEQIFMNLISNAVKFTPVGGSVDLTIERLETTDEYIVNRYQIIDTGIGMGDEFMQHLYEPFSQEGRTNTARESGTGLGMTIVKQLVALMGGTLEVESRINEGTTFTVTLRFEICKDAAQAAHDVRYTGADLQGLRILLCEDHPLNRQIAVKLLEKKGITVDTAENGREGVDRFASCAPGYYNLILMDIRMPILNGMEATKEIRSLARKDAKTVPVIAMTANAFSEDVENCLAAGMNAHISKPIEVDKMYGTIAKWCGRASD